MGRMAQSMAFLRSFLLALMGLAFVVAIGFVFVRYYSFIFSKSVDGQVIELDRVTQPTVVMGSAAVKAENVLYSFAVAVRTNDNHIFTGSSEDRQWAIVKKGQCVEAQFYPYPFWDLDKANTFFNVRLKKLKDCPQGTPDLPVLQESLESPETTESTDSIHNSSEETGM